MNQRTIEIIIGTDGQLSIDAVGFRGADCEKATAFLEQALGKNTEKQRKPEYYRRAGVRQTQEIG